MDGSVDIPLEYPSTSIMRYPQPRVTSHRWLHMTRLFLEHYLPVRIIDIASRLVNRPTNALRLFQRLYSSMGLLEFFATNEWTFVDTNTQLLYHSLSAADRSEFNFDVRHIEWPQYVKIYCLGIRQYVLGEDLANLERGRAHLAKLKCVQSCSDFLAAWAFWTFTFDVLPGFSSTRMW